MPDSKPARALSDAQIEQFIHDGFIRIDRAFPRELAEQGRTILWRDLPCDPDKPATWTQPVIRLGYYNDDPFRKAINSPLLHTAFDQLVGKGRWWPRADLGTFPVRFPSPHDPGDAGRHVAFEAGRDGKRPARDTGHRRRRHGLSVPPAACSRRANAPGIRAAFHGAATAAPVSAVQA